MPRNDDTTTRFRVDISELKKSFQEAQRQVRLANSEFQAATAGMDNWGQSADGLSAKINQLTSVLNAERTKLSNLERQYELTVQQMGEGSRAAEELRIKINNQTAVVRRTESELANYESRLEQVRNASRDAGDGTDDFVSSSERLESTIRDQENQLERLRNAYADVVLEQGEGSREARELGGQISTLSTELSNNRSQLADARSAADNFDNSLEDVDDSTENLSDGFSVLKGAIADLVADGIRWCIDSLKELVTESDKAFNSFQAQTGTSTEAMADFKDQINELYKGNYGESIQDVADAMAQVAQTTKETDPSKIQELTKNAIILRDTFGFEVNETMRAANMLIDQFGMTGEEAFNLIAQGAQNGLNKNDDLLDSINEYSVHYKQLGLTGEEFFNSLSNGAAAGTFSVDKLGDAMKEFGIRVKDGSESTATAFAQIGLIAPDMTKETEKASQSMEKYKNKIADLEQKIKYAEIEQANFNEKTSELTRIKMDDNLKKWNDELQQNKQNLSEAETLVKAWSDEALSSKYKAGELFEMFAAGGETAKAATQDVLDALFNMDDKVAQDAAGVALFGTMWEDLGADGVKALMDVNGEADKTAETLSEIDAIKYDDIGSAFSEIGRIIKVDLLQPIADELMPTINEFVGWLKGDAIPWIIDHSNEIIAVITGIGTAFLAFKAVTIIQGIITAFTALIGVIKSVGIAQTALNVIMSLNPVGLIVAAIAGLVAAFVVLWNKSEGFRNFWIELWENIKSLTKTVVDALVTFFTQTIPNAWNGFLEFCGNFIESIVTFFTELPGRIWEWLLQTINNIATWATNLSDKAKEAGKNFVDNIITFFQELPGKIGYFIGYVLGTIAKWVIDIATKAKEAGKNFIDNVITFFKELPGKVWEWLKNTISKIVTFTKDTATKAKEAGKNFVTNMIDFYKTLPSKIWEFLKNAISKVIEFSKQTATKAKEAGKNFIDNVITFFKELPGKVWEWLKNTIDKAKNFAKDLGEKGIEAAKNLITNIIDGVKELPGKMLEIGKNIVGGVWDGITSAADKFKNNVKDFFTGIVDGAKDALDINSPSRVFKNEVGKMIVLGISEGIKSNASKATEQMKKLTDSVLDAAQEGNFENAFGEFPEINSLRNSVSQARRTLNDTNSVQQKVYNFYQTNNSPKALSRIEIYRQTKNQLNFARGV